MRPPRRRDVGPHGVGREEEDVAVAARGQHDDIGDVRLDLAGHQVAGDDAPRAPVDDDEFEHLVPRVCRDRPGRDLPLQCLVGTDEQLLAGLATGVEGARHLDATEGAVVQQAAVFAGERNPLGDALVDDVGADLGQPVDVGLAGAVVAALDRVVEQPVGGVAVLLVVLRGVDAALGGDRVGTARGVLVAEGLHLVAGFAERGSGGATGQAGADDDDRELAAVGRVDEVSLELAGGPLLVDRAGGGLGVGDLVADPVEALDDPAVGSGGGRHGGDGLAHGRQFLTSRGRRGWPAAGAGSRRRRSRRRHARPCARGVGSWPCWSSRGSARRSTPRGTGACPAPPWR